MNWYGNWTAARSSGFDGTEAKLSLKMPAAHAFLNFRPARKFSLPALSSPMFSLCC